jgi:hypothetical protein
MYPFNMAAMLVTIMVVAMAMMVTSEGSLPSLSWVGNNGKDLVSVDGGWQTSTHDWSSIDTILVWRHHPSSHYIPSPTDHIISSTCHVQL